MENPNFIKMNHGKLEINVPRSMFKWPTAELIEPEVEKFRRTISARYPWLSKYALDEVVKEAQQAMEDYIASKKTAVQKVRELMAKGWNKEALKVAEENLIRDPENADLWYVTGEILCKLGRMEQGYNAINWAKDLAKPVTTARGKVR